MHSSPKKNEGTKHINQLTALIQIEAYCNKRQEKRRRACDCVQHFQRGEGASHIEAIGTIFRLGLYKSLERHTTLGIKT